MNNIFIPKKNLRPLNIWLSGAIPEKEYWPHPLLDRDILEFISYFSAIVFQKGGTIVHGSHPAFTPILVRQAKKFATSKEQLQLFVSGYFEGHNIERYSSFAITHIVKPVIVENDNDESRNMSLTLLRDEMAKSVNCVISIGGKRHLDSKKKAGVSEELQMAQDKSLPCYNLAGYGGASSSNESINSLNNFLSRDEAEYLTYNAEINFLPSTLISMLARDARKINLHYFIKKILNSLNWK